VSGTLARFLLPAAGLLAAALLPCAGAAQTPAEPVWAERPDDELYVFGLRLDRYVLSDGLVVFYDGEEAFVPLGAVTALLEFPIDVDPLTGTASGWFLDEDRSFRLDLAGPTVELAGSGHTIDPSQVERHPDDIYVSLSELQRWFPLIVELRFADLAIQVRGLEPLPLQERIAREERRRNLRQAVGPRQGEVVGPEERWIDWPFVDTSIQLSGRRQAGEYSRRGSFTSTVAGIVGGLDTEATAIADSDQDAPNVRLRVGRQSLDGGLLGPLDAREYALGDVATPDMPLVADNTVGRGLEISSFDLDRLQQTNQVTLRGELPLGWEVEIYRNGELIDFQTDGERDDGRYEFANLATVAGLNEFRLVFYGPQGQKREIVENYFVTPEFAEPGRTDFRFAANQRNRDLIDLDPETRAQQPDDGKGRVVFQLEHGLNETLSVGGGLASLSVDGERHNYASVNLQSSVFGALAQLDAALEDTGGLALGGRVQTRLGDWSFFGEQSFYEEFHSEQTDNSSVAGHLRSRSSLRVNGHTPDFGLGQQPLTAAIAHDIGENGDWQTNIFARLSAVVRPLNFALSTNTRLRRGRDRDTDARLLVGTLMGDFRLRGEVAVNLAPETEFDQLLLNADWRISEDFGARFGLRHQGGEQELSSATVGLNYQFEHVAVGLNVEGDSEGDYNARLGISFSLGRDPRDGRIAMRARPFARRGAVSAQVFLDEDNDGVFDADERAIPNAGFSGPRLPHEVRTDEQGGAFIVGLDPYREVEIGLNEGTLEDPFWVASQRPVRVVTRPGSTTLLLFPVIETGEVDGTVMVGGIGGQELRPGASLRVILSDLAGNVVAETVTAYDGYFFLERIPYGRYRLSLDEEQLGGLGYVVDLPREIVIGADEPFVIGQDFFAPPAATATAAGRSTTGQTE